MNPRPAHYECAALPLSYCGGSRRKLMPGVGLRQLKELRLKGFEAEFGHFDQPALLGLAVDLRPDIVAMGGELLPHGGAQVLDLGFEIAVR